VIHITESEKVDFRTCLCPNDNNRDKENMGKKLVTPIAYKDFKAVFNAMLASAHSQDKGKNGQQIGVQNSRDS
jgi:hypothetical protein